MKPKSAVATAVFLMLTPALAAQEAGAKTKSSPKAGPAQPVVMPAGDLKWTDLDPAGAPGVKVATLWGDHTKGAFGAFFTLPAGLPLPSTHILAT